MTATAVSALLSAAFFLGLATGVVASFAAVLTSRGAPGRGRTWWSIATVGFGVAGVLGILSIGVVLLAAAAATAIAAIRGAHQSRTGNV